MRDRQAPVLEGTSGCGSMEAPVGGGYGFLGCKSAKAHERCHPPFRKLWLKPLMGLPRKAEMPPHFPVTHFVTWTLKLHCIYPMRPGGEEDLQLLPATPPLQSPHHPASHFPTLFPCLENQHHHILPDGSSTPQPEVSKGPPHRALSFSSDYLKQIDIWQSSRTQMCLNLNLGSAAGPLLLTMYFTHNPSNNLMRSGTILQSMINNPQFQKALKASFFF